jgi:hypothetical protein
MNKRNGRALAGWLAIAATVFAAGCAGHLVQMQPEIANGGRAVAISVHPSNAKRVVVASETGGLFRTTNGGSKWRQVSKGATFSFTDVQYAPSSPSIVVAAAVADMRTASGGGIWRSNRGGSNWTQVALTPPAGCAADMSAMALDAEPGGRLWAGTVCGVAFSDDQGLGWEFLPAVAGYANDKTYAVLAPAAGQLRILTDAGLKVSGDGGGSWTLASTGLPPAGAIIKGVHNQIGVSPLDAEDLYWAFNYGAPNPGTGAWEWHTALFRSFDGGTSWSSAIDSVGINRPPFVRVAGAPTANDPNAYEVYFGDGSCGLQRATVTHGPTPAVGPWTLLSVDHCDTSDVSFGTDLRSPLLVAGDGGLHRTTNGGATWTFTGGGAAGYNALQVTEVTGQLQPAGGAHLYFGTQDNDIWASADGGASWGARLCCEGFFLNVPREYVSAAQTRVTGVTCGACFNFSTGPLLAEPGLFPNPPNDAGNPRLLLATGQYVQNTAITGITGSIFNLTEDGGGGWTPRYGFPEELRDFSKVAGDEADPVMFVAVRKPGATPDGNEILGIRRITGVLGGGAPVVSEVTGFGSLGIFPTMFAWYKPFGVDPRDPNRLIVPDILDEVVKKTTNGGGSWEPDTMLTRLVTENGSLRFRTGPFTQITAFGYDPECSGHVMVGTMQAGIFQSFDDGDYWTKVPNSEQVPFVSSFFFSGRDEAVVSSYGRGLWKVRYECPVPPGRLRLPDLDLVFAEPTIYWKGGRIPIGQIGNPDACPVCTFVLVDGGRILELAVDPRSNRVTGLRVSGGQVKQFGWDRAERPMRLRAALDGAADAPRFAGAGDAAPGGMETMLQQQDTTRFGGDTLLAFIVDRGRAQIAGLLMQGDTVRGVILSNGEVGPEAIPARQPEPPRIRVSVPATGGTAIRALDSITVHGSGWDPRFPLEVTVDRVPLPADQVPRVNEQGEFVLSIPPILSLGGHTILVRQRSDRGLKQDAFTFNVTVQDFEQGKEPNRPPAVVPAP